MMRGTLTHEETTLIPAEIRERLGLMAGPLYFEEREGGLFIRAGSSTSKLAGMLNGQSKRPLLSIPEEKEAAEVAWAEAGADEDLGGTG